jgi:hypothetical protein
MRISRRGFLAAGAAPLSSSLFPWNAPKGSNGVTCALDESRAGYERAIVPRGPDEERLLVFPAAVGWDPSIVRQVRNGATVIFESAAGFGDAKAFGEQRAGLRSAFDLTLETPTDPWARATKPAYIDLLWPAAAKLRDFSSLVVVRGGETVGRLGRLPVAALQQRGAGLFLFLGSPIGPALWTGDPQAHAWLSSVFATTRSYAY